MEKSDLSVVLHGSLGNIKDMIHPLEIGQNTFQITKTYPLDAEIFQSGPKWQANRLLSLSK